MNEELFKLAQDPTYSIERGKEMGDDSPQEYKARRKSLAPGAGPDLYARTKRGCASSRGLFVSLISQQERGDN